MSVKGFAEQLRAERLQRSWSQEQLAEMIGTTSTSVSRWERSITLPSLYFRQQLSALFEKDLQGIGLARAISDTTAPLHEGQEEPHSPAFSLLWHLPHQRNPLFTGREAILSCLHNQFHTDKTAGPPRVQAICGLAGMGKTQTAIEYAYRHMDTYQAIFWLQAETRAALVSGMVTLAEDLHLVKKEEYRQDEAIKAAKRWLQKQTGWLLILDNIEDFQLVREVLPVGSSGHVLLTTRSLSTGPHIQRLDLEKMEPEEGALFLLRRAKRLGPKDPLELASTADRDKALEIALLLDGLPLALDQAGAYIEETACTLSHYTNLFQRHQSILLGLRDLSGGLNADHSLSVNATLSLTLERVKWMNPAALELLQLCAFLHPDAIPEELLIEGEADLSPGLRDCVLDPLKLDATIADLRRYALLQRNADAQMLSLHRLVQVVIRNRMDEEEQRRWATLTVQLVNRIFPQVEYWVASSQYQRYFAHAQVCAALIEAWNIDTVPSVRLLVQLARACSQMTLYGQAESLLIKALAILKRQGVATYPEQAEVQQLLGWLSSLQGNYEEAIWYLQQAMAVHEQMSEPDHSIMAGCLVDLASIYLKQDRWAEAEPFCLRALIMHQGLEELAHQALTLSLHNLGSCYCGQGKYAQAEPLLRRALDIHQEALGMEHPLTATSFYALGKLYLKQGKSEQAEPLLRQAFQVRKITLGEEHPQTRQAKQDLIICEAGSNHSDTMQPTAAHIYEKCDEQCEVMEECLPKEKTGEKGWHELTDEQWARVQPLLPPPKAGRKGRPAHDHRRMINAILWIEHTGSSWRNLPKRYGKWQSVFSRLSRWRRAGVWQQILAVLEQEQLH